MLCAVDGRSVELRKRPYMGGGVLGIAGDECSLELGERPYMGGGPEACYVRLRGAV